MALESEEKYMQQIRRSGSGVARGAGVQGGLERNESANGERRA
jgi:hypothetical protein